MKKMNKIDIDKIKKNDLMAVTHYVKVVNVNQKKFELLVTDVDNHLNTMKIQGKDILEVAFSADQFDEEKKVSKTQAAEYLIHALNRPFSVSFQKLDGSERILRGRLICAEPLLGRSMVEDLDDTSGHSLRQVDHRTINWLIVDCVKYVVN